MRVSPLRLHDFVIFLLFDFLKSRGLNSGILSLAVLFPSVMS